MVGKVKTLDHRLLTRRCVCCGYDGPLLRGGHVRQCVQCGCDFRIRPPRSYAEMEGLLGQPVVIDAPIIEPQYQERLIHRWLAFLFFSLVGLIALVYLAAAMAV